MARTSNKLSARVVAQTKTPGLYADGDGLFLQVTAGRDGSPRRSWLIRFTSPSGRRREMGLGRADFLDLAEAREAARAARKSAAGGVDPIDAKRERIVEAAAQAARAMTFRSCAEAYIAANEATWRNPKHRQQWSNTLSSYAFPVFGDVAVADVDQAMVMRVIDPLWSTKTETARRLRGRIENILDWAAVRGYRTSENPARWRGHLDKALPAPDKTHRVQHHRAVPVDELPGVFSEVRHRTGAGADCLQFLILTAARFSEAAGARWNEFDLTNAVWNVPAERMKGGRGHRVPLSKPALNVLRRRRGPGTPPGSDSLVFGSEMRPGARLSDMTLTAVLRRLGRSETVHGFRSCFRDWAAERTNVPREVAEAALAHAVGDRTEAAYRRSDLFEKRRKLLDAWGEYCTEADLRSGVVLPIHNSRRIR